MIQMRPLWVAVLLAMAISIGCDMGGRNADRVLEGHLDWVNTLDLDRSGTIIASGSEDHTIRVWTAPFDGKHKTLQGHTRGVTSVAIAPSGKILAWSLLLVLQ